MKFRNNDIKYNYWKPTIVPNYYHSFSQLNASYHGNIMAAIDKILPYEVERDFFEV